MKLLKGIKVGRKILISNLVIVTGKKGKQKSKEAVLKKTNGRNYYFTLKNDKKNMLVLRNIKNKNGVIDEPHVHVDVQDIYGWDTDKNEFDYQISYTIIQKI